MPSIVDIASVASSWSEFEGLINFFNLGEGMTISELNMAYESVKTFQAIYEPSVLAGGSAGPASATWALQPAAASDALVVSGGSASEAIAIYEGAGGATSAVNAATSGGHLVEVMPTAIQKTSSGFSVGGLLAADVGVVGAAVAPLLGVALGAGLYSLNPELWTKISQAILPWAYDDGTVPVYVDGDGQTYVDENIIQAIKDLFEEEGIGGASTEWTPPEGYDIVSPMYFIPVYPGMDLGDETGSSNYVVSVSGDDIVYACRQLATERRYEYIFVSKSTFTVQTQKSPTNSSNLRIFNGSSSYTIDGLTCYECTLVSGSNQSMWNYIPVSATQTINFQNAVAITFLKGAQVPGGYPEGTSQWTGDSVDWTQNPIDVVTDPGDETDPTSAITSPYYPVALPKNGSDASLDPTENPDPRDVTDDTSQVDWYIDLSKLPFPNPIPNYNPDPNPDENPSEQPQPQPEPDVPNPTKPADEGDSPTPVEPTIAPPFDIEASNAGGLVNVYNPTSGQLYSFANWLWVTYRDTTITKLFNNPFDGVVSLHEIYATPNRGASMTIKSGFLDSGVSAVTVPNRYSTINCGNIVIPEFYGNYLDYSPYSKCYVYLPFIGIVELSVDDIVGHAVNITYGVDSYSGACIAMITVAKDGYSNLIYQFSGNCAVQHPISGGSQANIVAAQAMAVATGLGSVVSGIATALSGNIMGAFAGVTQGAANAFGNAISAKSSVQHSGTFGANFGPMGVKKPYIIIKRPTQVVVPNYQKEYGFPAHKFVKIGACTGYLRVREVNVISARATDEEKTKIEELLKGGVFVT